MRQTCQHGASVNEPCGKPAVDFVFSTNDDGETYKRWLCAEHWDLLQRLRKILLDAKAADRDYKFRPPKPGREID